MHNEALTSSRSPTPNTVSNPVHDPDEIRRPRAQSSWVNFIKMLSWLSK